MSSVASGDNFQNQKQAKPVEGLRSKDRAFTGWCRRSAQVAVRPRPISCVPGGRCESIRSLEEIEKIFSDPVDTLKDDANIRLPDADT
jgi:hypothetical protein